MFRIHPSLCGYRIFIDNKEVARATFSFWTSQGRLIIQRKTLRMVGRGFPIHNRYELRQGKTCVASMKLKMLPLPPSQVLEYNHQVYEWQDSRIISDNQDLGSVRIRRLGPWGWSTIEVELPEALPLLLKLFIVLRLLPDEQGN